MGSFCTFSNLKKTVEKLKSVLCFNSNITVLWSIQSSVKPLEGLPPLLTSYSNNRFYLGDFSSLALGRLGTLHLFKHKYPLLFFDCSVTNFRNTSFPILSPLILVVCVGQWPARRTSRLNKRTNVHNTR